MAEINQSVAFSSPEMSDLGSRDSQHPHSETPLELLNALTEKQRLVLDLLIQHKTSKEISRLLGISHHTVDQRIMLARSKLGAGSRSEVAQAYRRLVANAQAVSALYERSVYDFSDVAPALNAPHALDTEDRTDLLPPIVARQEMAPIGLSQGGSAVAEPFHHVLPEMFDGPYGTLLRLGTIAVFAIFLILIVLGGLAMFAQLSQIIAH
jgi:DNA-binding CsgD family transcriptional regulator